jgi:hypothetical protein
MRRYLSDPPGWLSLASADLVGGAGMAFLVRTEGANWTAAGVIAVVTGVLFAVAVWRSR